MHVTVDTESTLSTSMFTYVGNMLNKSYLNECCFKLRAAKKYIGAAYLANSWN